MRERRYHKVRRLETSTGVNYSVTLSKSAAQGLSGCMIREFVTTNGVLLLKSGCGIDERGALLACGFSIDGKSVRYHR